MAGWPSVTSLALPLSLSLSLSPSLSLRLFPLFASPVLADSGLGPVIKLPALELEPVPALGLKRLLQNITRGGHREVGEERVCKRERERRGWESRQGSRSGRLRAREGPDRWRTTTGEGATLARAAAWRSSSRQETERRSGPRARSYALGGWETFASSPRLGPAPWWTSAETLPRVFEAGTLEDRVRADRLTRFPCLDLAKRQRQRERRDDREDGRRGRAC